MIRKKKYSFFLIPSIYNSKIYNQNYTRNEFVEII